MNESSTAGGTFLARLHPRSARRAPLSSEATRPLRALDALVVPEYAVPSDLVRFAAATKQTASTASPRRKRNVADDAPRQRDRRCRGVEHRARQHGRSRAKVADTSAEQKQTAAPKGGWCNAEPLPFPAINLAGFA